MPRGTNFLKQTLHIVHWSSFQEAIEENICNVKTECFLAEREIRFEKPFSLFYDNVEVIKGKRLFVWELFYDLCNFCQHLIYNW